MSNIDINYEFSQFGSKAKTLGILSILGFIFGLIGNFVPVFGFINLVISIIILVILFSALGILRKIGDSLNNRLLIECRSKIINAFILFLIGMFFFFLAIVLISNNAIGAGIGLIIIGIILLLIGAIFRIQGWSRLQSFFEQNRTMFPASIGADAESGAKFLKIAGILYLTIILIFIGFILEVVGYFKLSSLQNMTGAPAAQPAAAPAAAPAPAAAEPAKRFCPNCGSPVSGQEKFCSSCGAELK